MGRLSSSGVICFLRLLLPLTKGVLNKGSPITERRVCTNGRGGATETCHSLDWNGVGRPTQRAAWPVKTENGKRKNTMRERGRERERERERKREREKEREREREKERGGGVSRHFKMMSLPHSTRCLCSCWFKFSLHSPGGRQCYVMLIARNRGQTGRPTVRQTDWQGKKEPAFQYIEPLSIDFLR